MNSQQIQNGRVIFNLVNESSKDIVAWNLRILTSLTDGTEQTDGYGQDFAISSPRYADSEPRVAHTVGPLAPGQIHRTEMPLSGKEGTRVIDVSIEVRAVVFRDRSYEGDPVEIKSIFESRRASIIAQEHWLTQFRRLQESAHDDRSFRKRAQTVVTRLENGLDNYGAGGITSQHTSARLTEEGIGQDFQFVLKKAEEVGLVAALGDLIERLDEERRTMMLHVSPSDRSRLSKEGGAK